MTTSKQQGHIVGNLRQRYEIYVVQAKSLGWPVKTFDEWLNS